MKLTKTAYLFSGGGEIIGYDRDGRPIFSKPSPNIPFEMEWEPYGYKLAETQYGVFVEDIKFRMFTKPDERLILNTEFVYKHKVYSVREVLPYDKHYEILVRFERELNE